MTPPALSSSPRATSSRPRTWVRISALLGLIACVVGVAYLTSAPKVEAAAEPEAGGAAEPALPPAPDLTGGVAWLNTAGPISLKDLRGKVVILDFWTLCCINCIHIMPDLEKLEKKYPNNLVVIGVHSPKFENEKDTASIRKAVLRYELAHPVVNDADRKLWNAYGVQSWPTIAVIDPEGNFVGAVAGEGNLELLDKVVDTLIKKHRAKKTLNEKPIRFDLVRYREKGDTPLFFPGKVLADEKSQRLFIADSTHHRIVVTDLSGKKIAIYGTGSPGLKDGDPTTAQFDDPQGMALDGEMLYVADRKNHCLREIDLKTNLVRTIAGTGVQTTTTRYVTNGPAKKTGLNSPWALYLHGKTLYIAMAGHHQIWTMNLTKNTVSAYAGNGRENIKDGPVFAAEFAQPSGLTADDRYLYVADSEVSAIRRVPFNPNGRVDTLVGEGLFEFGDKDGIGSGVRLQHALGVALMKDGKLLVADTYNSKLKILDPKTKKCETYLGGGKDALFNEPAGLSIAGGKAYVADTNAHRIRVVDLATKNVSTLELSGVNPPPPQKEWLPPVDPKASK